MFEQMFNTVMKSVETSVEGLINTINKGNFIVGDYASSFHIEFLSEENIISAGKMDVERLESLVKAGHTLHNTHFGYLLVSKDESQGILFLADDSTEYNRERLVACHVMSLSAGERDCDIFSMDGSWDFTDKVTDDYPMFISENFLLSGCNQEGYNLLLREAVIDSAPLGVVLNIAAGKEPKVKALVRVKQGKLFDVYSIKLLSTDGEKMRSADTSFKVLADEAPLYSYLKEQADKVEDNYATFRSLTESSAHVIYE